MKLKIFLIISLFLIINSKAVFAGEAVALTDKSYYGSQEEIKVTLKNDTENSIFTIAASLTPEFSMTYIEKKNDLGNWIRLAVRCQWPECDNDFDFPLELKPGEVASFKWKPEIYQDKKYLTPDPGVYRIILEWQIRTSPDSKEWIWQEVETNEFELSL